MLSSVSLLLVTHADNRDGAGYKYMEELAQLDSHTPVEEQELDQRWLQISTPVKVERLAQLLESHPDRRFVRYLVAGFEWGFCIGFDRGQALEGAKSNMPSVGKHPEVVQHYLMEEQSQGRVLGPFNPRDVTGVHVSSFGVIPKNHQPGKWRLIVDLSHPEGKSVNDGIRPELCSLSYTKVDDVVERLVQLGQRAEMAKVDIQSAYRIIPVHPQDRYLLGMQWKGQYYIDSALPFGLRSAPKIFNALADAVQWVMLEAGVSDLWHYLDDYITVGVADSGGCQFNLDMMRHICEQLGVPLVANKCVGPATCLTFLGIEIDSGAMELRLPEEKLEWTRMEIARWGEELEGRRFRVSGSSGKGTKKRRWTCTKRQLSSLAGLLQHASVVVQPGRTFLRRIYDKLAEAKQPYHYIRVDDHMRSDIAWWAQFLESWNGVAMMSAGRSREADAIVTSDASGSWGCGAFWGKYWFQLVWSGEMCREPIMVKELVPMVVAAAVWGKQWRELVVCCRSDNQAAVAAVNSRTSHNASVMHMLRCFEAHFEFKLVASYIPGKETIQGI